MLGCLRKLSQKGDTIVEVMIVLAVLGFALSIAYTTATRALSNTRQAQESSEATRLAQTQIEMLRALAPSKYNDTFDPHDQYDIFKSRNPFCLATGAFSPYTIYDYATGDTSPSSGGAIPPNPCQNQGRSKIYNQKVTYDSASGTFTILVSWDNVRGDGTDTVQMSYRVYPNGQ